MTSRGSSIASLPRNLGSEPGRGFVPQARRLELAAGIILWSLLGLLLLSISR